MTKTQQVIEQLNDAQKRAIKYICAAPGTRGTKARVEAPKRNGWYQTDAKCRKDTAQVLCSLGLVKIDELSGHAIVKPTALGNRVATAL